ncbi:D-alanine--D-alanine ligase family protein [Cytophaga hutchinsonii]|uniref:D-alanine--D-alanine ligase n=1 Tax=Cytophaga hutchinsonii (strain ATCC 33406 / DSM 1761 / CIP 103989 / NBRC 15051 / NCIMB 9469 / D465) TaxID=269798 RepID=A0A6N4SPG5_CYTH3|nr:D-alanine--D-alanine ligase [Cytophaga hutchinsonii]ABG58203.1 D-alanine--D-alanine ligase A [Cytophaga hutchinsonii ATCC 33406]SFX55202.1 D-alanine-D-alanine ligase [Cytophaga hutchinsonii ATCC 33406]
MRIGIIFGGQSREREISFAGGRTVYDNLNKDIFTTVPIFVDSLGQFILLDWQYIYKGTIRDFYPPFEFLPKSIHGFQVYVESLGDLPKEERDAMIQKVGRKIEPSDLKELIDFAFLALHGPYGEDGAIQGMLDWNNIPYSGSGILPSAIGINKYIQKKLVAQASFNGPNYVTYKKSTWLKGADTKALLAHFESSVGFPFVVKAPSQGSSIGITVISERNEEKLKQALNRSFFLQEITAADWNTKTEHAKIKWVATLTDIRDGIGMPVNDVLQGKTIYHPEELLAHLNQSLSSKERVLLESLDNEEEIIIESFIKGQEFSCIVIQDEDGNPIALPPTGIVKGNDFFDYRSKYLPGMSRKITPIDIPGEQVELIRSECCRLYSTLQFNVYARIDGFISPEGEVFLNDPNTTSGMMPSSFFFHQAAEIGLNPSQFLTYIIRTSIQERIKDGKRSLRYKQLLATLDQAISSEKNSSKEKIKIAVVMGGYSSERHISVESGRNIFEKLSSSTKYQPLPVFLTGSDEQHRLFILPINILLKDNADDIREKVINFKGHHPIIEHIAKETESISSRYVSNAIKDPKEISYKELSELVDGVFIALHGRPGEDGSMQKELEKYQLPYNGSGIQSSQITINKFETNRILREHGISVANHRMVYKQEWLDAGEKLLSEIESGFIYPIIAKPSDDGCSSAVKKIKNRDELRAYTRLMFGEEAIQGSVSSSVLGLKYNEEFPQKDYFLIEDLVSKGNAKHFLEVTGGLMTRFNDKGNVEYEIFEPSESLATGDVLSLEEKFLAGEGQNITPARYTTNKADYEQVASEVRATLKRVAEVLNIQGYARIDAFVRVFENNRSETIIIEVNSLPGMTPATCIFHQTAINGYKPYDFIDNILTFGIEREKKKLAKI